MSQTVFLKDYQPSDFRVEHIELKFELDPQATFVEARFVVHRVANTELRSGSDSEPSSDAALFLHGEELTPVWVKADGQQADYQLCDQGIRIDGIGSQAEIHTRCQIHPKQNKALSGLYFSGQTLCTQCEPEGFRRITWFLDRPDCLSRFTVRLEADCERFPILLAGGNRIDSGALAEGRHFVTWHDPFPKPAYLFALVAGELSSLHQSFTTRSGRNVDLYVYAIPEHLSQCHFALDVLKRAMRWDEQRYGLEYDLDEYKIVAIADFNMGAMENKGLNIFNVNCVLADEHSATDDDFIRVEAVIAHEYFHNWSGNRVTLRDWFQLSLKEGLTVFREQQYCEDVLSAPLERIAQVNLLRSVQFAEDAGPTAHPVQPDSYQKIDNFYTTTVYEKGAELIRQLHRLMGEQRFRAGMDRYFSHHDGQAVTIEDLLKALQPETDLDLQHYLRWYQTAGTPRVVAKRIVTQEDGFCLELTQHSQSAEPLCMAIALSVFDANGQALSFSIPGVQTVVEDGVPQATYALTSKQARLKLCGVPQDAMVSLLRGFSAPIVLEHDLSDEEQMRLLSCESDWFIVWEISRNQAVQALLAQDRCAVADLSELFEAILLRHQRDKLQDVALLAELVQLPSLAYLMQCTEQVDPLALYRRRQHAERELGRAFKDRWQMFYHCHLEASAPSLSQDSIRRRALLNVSMYYLHCAADDNQVALQHLNQGGSMSNQLNALNCLAQRGGTDAFEALQRFPQQWHHTPVLIESWFRCMARSQSFGSIQGIKSLCAHQWFYADNPNLLSSVYGGFCHNTTHFHATDGSGYAFLADAIRTIDAYNPQTAAHLVRPLLQWRKFIAPHGEAMREQLVFLSAQKVSHNLAEMIEKALAT